MISVKNLSKTYGTGDSQVNALSGVDLQVNEGEFVAIVGPSGCGKSTLLHILGAMDTPTDGSIDLSGQNLSKLSQKKLTDVRLKKIGFIFQSFNLMPTLTALENVMLPVKLNGGSKKRQKKKHWIYSKQSDSKTAQNISPQKCQAGSGKG